MIAPFQVELGDEVISRIRAQVAGATHQPDALHRDGPNRVVAVVLLQLPLGVRWKDAPDGPCGSSHWDSSVPEGDAERPATTNMGRADYRVVHWSLVPRGGHFACLEQPQLLCATSADSFARTRRGQRRRSSSPLRLVKLTVGKPGERKVRRGEGSSFGVYQGGSG